MAKHRGEGSAALRPLHNLLNSGVLGDWTDGELLREFMTRRKETAEPSFSVLVGRHGPMVWRVCRSVLTDPHDAEDAFQATFMVLVQHARSVRRQDSLASWLYGVAYRVACRARSAEARRSRHEQRRSGGSERAAPACEPERAELQGIIAEELHRLSDSHRLAVVLCDLEELTHEQAAARLGWPVGTVKSRLARGRERLRSRLIRRGVAPAISLLGVVGLGDPGLAAPPSSLVGRVVQFALGASSGLSLAGSFSGVITLLVREVSKAMWISRLRWATLAVLGSGVLGLGVAVLWQRTQAQQTPAARPEAPVPPRRGRDDDATWARHVGNLKRIGLALHNYLAAEGHFPPAAITGKDGKPLLSWRVAILPYLEDFDGRGRQDLYKAFRLEEPWDSPHNRALLARMPAVFAAPGKADREQFTTVYRGFVSQEENVVSGTGMGMMQMMGSAGGGSMMQGPVPQDRRNAMRRGRGNMAGMGIMGGMMAGPMRKGRRLGVDRRSGADLESEKTDEAEQEKTVVKGQLKFQAPKPEMPGGEQAAEGPTGPGAPGGMGSMMASMMAGSQHQATSAFRTQTIFREHRGVNIQEVTDGTSNTIMVVEAAEAVPWTKPDDLTLPVNAPLPRFGDSMSDGFAALFADGRVILINHRIEERVIRNLITPNGGEIISGAEFPHSDSPPPGGLTLQSNRTTPGVTLKDESQQYAGAGTLQNAVGILKDRLKREGKSELAEWLTESRARRTIRAGLQTYESYLREIGEPQLAREQFEIAKPTCRQIAEEGIWPPDCWFSAASSVEARDGITYDRHQVRLVVEGLDRGNPFQLSILILDVFYGPVERQRQAPAR